MTSTEYFEMQGTRAPVRMWIDPLDVEQTALQQIRTVADMPWAHGVAVMPDVHAGKGATIGTVIASREHVCPAAVGVDIGCGMNAVPVRMGVSQLPDDLGALRAAIEAIVPVGQSSHDTALDLERTTVSGLRDWGNFVAAYDRLSVTLSTRRLDSDSYKSRVLSQLGTLGGGNHFIEVCVDGGGMVWLMLHSGSRNVGKELAERHIDIAASLPENADVPDKHLAAFRMGSPEMEAYRNDLYWAQEYARRNRAVMMGLVKKAFARALGLDYAQARAELFGDEISCHHNYVSEEEFDGERLIVTRKGAISTRDGRLGVIPGSMGTGSYIVRGLGNEAAYCSASHGAGRKMSRGEAKRRFTVEDLAAQTAGVECRKDEGVIDEAPGAYKSLEVVMKNQRTLVAIEEKLDTVLCVKG
jgi:tRNA-splicing ligase RtcB